MKSQKLTQDVSLQDWRELSGVVGDFIRYWGFRRIHGQIWVQLYLSQEALSGADLVERLQVSKALVSPALQELLSYGLIKHVGGDEKTKTYAAAEDVYGVIKTILIERERKMIKKADDICGRLLSAPSDKADAEVSTARAQALQEMIKSAGSALDIIIKLANKDSILGWKKLKRDV